MKSIKPKKRSVKDEIVGNLIENSKIATEKPEESEVKEETIEAEEKSKKPEESEVKEEIIDLEVNSDNK